LRRFELSGDGIGVTRPSYGRAETLGLDHIAELAADGGLAVERDAAANLVVTLAGSDPSLPAVLTGSHMDSVPQGGNYDGAAGIVAGLVCMLRMRSEGDVPQSKLFEWLEAYEHSLMRNIVDGMPEYAAAAWG
jgi:N-carbamoyl-L-amino-acid hydrolase